MNVIESQIWHVLCQTGPHLSLLKTSERMRYYSRSKKTRTRILEFIYTFFQRSVDRDSDRAANSWYYSDEKRSIRHWTQCWSNPQKFLQLPEASQQTGPGKLQYTEYGPQGDHLSASRFQQIWRIPYWDEEISGPCDLFHWGRHLRRSLPPRVFDPWLCECRSSSKSDSDESSIRFKIGVNKPREIKQIEKMQI